MININTTEKFEQLRNEADDNNNRVEDIEDEVKQILNIEE